jgi:hypothetical protein
MRIASPPWPLTQLATLRIVQLGDADRERLRGHLRRLDPDDRRMRSCAP